MVAGPGLPGGHREVEALQEAGEEEEELHAGQGLPEADAAACGSPGVRGEPAGLGPTLPGSLRRGRRVGQPGHLRRRA